MNHKHNRAKIAESTVACLDAGAFPAHGGKSHDLSAGLSAQLRGTEILEHAVDPGAPTTGAMTVRVSALDVVNAVIQGPENPFCLVFASAKRPGGGFLDGANAQEESLARASSLYHSLRNADQFYGPHRRAHDPAYSSRIVYVPHAAVFRDPSGHFLKAPVSVTFCVCAAPNISAMQDAKVDVVQAILTERIERLLDLAAARGHRNLILGAWGCGVFGNDPKTVAETFAKALKTRPWFDDICFAIYGNVEQYLAFESAMLCFQPGEI